MASPVLPKGDDWCADHGAFAADLFGLVICMSSRVNFLLRFGLVLVVIAVSYYMGYVFSLRWIRNTQCFTPMIQFGHRAFSGSGDNGVAWTTVCEDPQEDDLEGPTRLVVLPATEGAQWTTDGSTIRIQMDGFEFEIEACQ